MANRKKIPVEMGNYADEWCVMSKRAMIERLLVRIFDVQVISARELPLAFERDHLRRLFSKFEINAVFDVGANGGQYAQMLREKVGYKGIIISYEPNPKCAEILRELAKSDPRWFVEEAAIDSAVGTREFNVYHSDEFSSFHRPSSVGNERFQQHMALEANVQVRTTTLTAELERYGGAGNNFRPFLKMDTQGHDLVIAKSSGSCLNKFVALQSELALTELYEDAGNYHEAIEYYRKMGFSLSAFVPNNLGHFPRLYEMDCIMFNERYFIR